jgi:hypothetical protein
MALPGSETTANFVLRTKESYFTADLRLSRAKSRSGQRAAANRQLALAMGADSEVRRRILERFGDDAYERVSANRNPRGAEWDHSRMHKYSLQLLSRQAHAAITRSQPSRVGGYALLHNEKSPNTLIGMAKAAFQKVR